MGGVFTVVSLLRSDQKMAVVFPGPLGSSDLEVLQKFLPRSLTRRLAATKKVFATEHTEKMLVIKNTSCERNYPATSFDRYLMEPRMNTNRHEFLWRTLHIMARLTLPVSRRKPESPLKCIRVYSCSFVVLEKKHRAIIAERLLFFFKGGLIQIPKIDALEERLVEQSPAFEGRLFRGRVLLVRFSHELLAERTLFRRRAAS